MANDCLKSAHPMYGITADSPYPSVHSYSSPLRERERERESTGIITISL